MARYRIGIAVAAAMILWMSPLTAASTSTAERPGVHGRILTGSAPLVRASVYAYQLVDLSLQKVYTDHTGNFVFDSLPAGLYKIVAHKPGFLPAVMLLSRAANDARQYVELHLAEEVPGEVREGESFWSVRDQVPTDILREIETARLEEAGVYAPDHSAFASSLHAKLEAMAGVDGLSSDTSGQVTSGVLGVEGTVAGVELGLQGRYWELEPGASGPTGEQASSRALSFDLRSQSDARLHVSSLSNSRRGGTDDRQGPMDFEDYSVRWVQPVGDRSVSQVRAQYTEETNFYRQGSLYTDATPLSSRRLQLEGTYQASFADRHALEAGVRYLEWQSLDLDPSSTEPLSTMELYGRGGLRVKPTVLVEYGLATRMRDGRFSLVPHGEVILQLGSLWQATARVSRRFGDDGVGTSPYAFEPLLFRGGAECGEMLDEECYQVVFSQESGNGKALAVAAVHRRVGETLRLYFHDDLVDRLESLYLVKGDELPEVRFVLARQIHPKVLARLESNLASGGGGILYATDDSSRQPYENQVRYLVTSLDTRFQPTSTGIFVAFHHLEQDLAPVGGARGAATTRAMELDRLQVMLTQDLNILLDMAADWAVRLGMEISRGSNPLKSDYFDEADKEFHKRLTGGLSLRF